MKMETRDWLLEGPPWLGYAVKKQLLKSKADLIPVLKDPLIKSYKSMLLHKEQGFNRVLEGNASYMQKEFWYLYFLSEIGLTAEDLGFEKHFERVLKLEDSEHRFSLSKEMKPNYLCISSIFLTAMVRMSPTAKKQLKSHINLIINEQRLDGGWHCAKNRAVGAKLEDTESCPMDNVTILFLLSEYPKNAKNPKFNGALDLLLNHWANQKKHRPYGFGIGSDFKKLRYPSFKYGILQVLDLLSRYEYSAKHPEFLSMLEFVRNKNNEDRYQAESCSKMFQEADFGQKKDPSRWLTFLVERINKRIESIANQS